MKKTLLMLVIAATFSYCNPSQQTGQTATDSTGMSSGSGTTGSGTTTTGSDTGTMRSDTGSRRSDTLQLK